MRNPLLETIQISLNEMLTDAVNIVLPIENKNEIHTEELALIENATHNRRMEFITGRLAAKQALAALAINDVPLLKGKHGEPLWPSGVSGSISHTKNICIATVSNADMLLGLGVDIEAQRILKLGIQRTICREEELSLYWHKNANMAKLILFSIKESIYKALYPTQQRFITFKEVLVKFDKNLEFSATIVDTGLTCSGCYRVIDGFVLSTTQLKNNFN